MICSKLGMCVISELDNTEISKCDCLYVIDTDERSAVLIELKGADVSKALKQIGGTLDLYKDLFRTWRVYGRVIVTSSTPNLKAGPEYVNLVRKIRLNYNGNIKIVERKFVEKDINLSDE